MEAGQSNGENPDQSALSAPVVGDLHLDLVPGGRPLHEQLRRELREAVRTGRLPHGSRLPPSRRLAAELGCSRWAVTEAYAQLVAEGYLAAVVGSGTRVAWRRPPEVGAAARTAGAPAPVRTDLTPGLPDLRAFPRRAWLEALRSVAATTAFTDLGHPDPRGHPVLRSTLAGHVVRTRDAVATADDVVVGTSVQDVVRRLCRSLLERGHTAVAVEDPGWRRLHHVVATSGLEVVPVPCDDAGLQVARLEEHTEVRAVIVTAAHHFPLGVLLSPERRNALLSWARARDGLVIEDDYDAEYRFDRAPVAALQGMDPTRVALVKSLSKTLSPALGLGWTVLPRPWAMTLLSSAPAPAVPPTLDQLAFARLVESGAYDRHLRATRIGYRRRRDLLVEQLREHLPEATVVGIEAGLHLLVRLPPGTDTAEVVRRAARAGVGVGALHDYAVTTSDPEAPGLVLGYGNLRDADVRPAVQVLVEAVGAAVGGPDAGRRDAAG